MNPLYYNRKFIYALLSLIFATLTAILAKIGINAVDLNVAMAIRTSVILIMAWIIIFLGNMHYTISNILVLIFFNEKCDIKVLVGALLISIGALIMTL